jgi:protein SCO1/2
VNSTYMKISLVLIGLLAFALGIGIARYYMPDSDPVLDTSGNSNTKVPVTPGRFGGDFTLLKEDQAVKLSDFRGKLVVMYFGYASCPDICPTTLAPEELEQVQPIFISVDPQRDQGEKLTAYASYFHPSFIGITGTEEEVQKVANQYGAFFIKVESDSAMGYLVDHTSKTYMVDQDGKYVTILPHDMTRDDMLNALRKGLN